MLSGANNVLGLSGLLPFATNGLGLTGVANGAASLSSQDSVSLSDLAGLSTSETTGKTGSFSDTFNSDVSAYLLGMDSSKLTAEQSEGLGSFIESIYEENLARESDGKPAMTRDEVNELIGKEISKYDESVSSTSTAKDGAIAEAAKSDDKDTIIGKTLKELGISEITDEQMNELDSALNAYTDGDEDALSELSDKAKKFKTENDAKAEEEAKAKEEEATKAKEDAKSKSAAANKAAQPTSIPSSSGGSGGGGGVGGAGGGGGVRSAGGSGGVGSSNGASAAEDTAAAAASQFDLAEDIPALQQQKAQAQSKVGEITGEIDGKKSEMNRRKGQLVDEAASDDEFSLKGSVDHALYKAQQAAFDQAQGLKEEAQTKLTQNTQDLANNQSDLLKNTSERQTNKSELSAARSEASALKKPEAPSGDDKEAKANYDSAMSEYNAKKAELDEKVSKLESKEAELNAAFEKLESKKASLEQDKAKSEKEIAKQTEAMNKAQEAMDKQVKEFSENDPELKKAIEEDAELKTLESDIASLETELATQKELITAVDEEIAAKESADPVAKGLKADEAGYKLEQAVDKAGANSEELDAKAQDEAAQNKYGKPFDELTETQQNELKGEVSGRKAVGSMEWAEEELREHPTNEEAKAIVESGQEYLERRADIADDNSVAALSALPDELKGPASEAMEEAVAKAAEDGTDQDVAARTALSKYAQEQLDGGELSDENKSLVETLASASGASLQSAKEVNEGKHCQSNIEFNGQLAELPEGARNEAYTLLASVEALDKPLAREGVATAVTEAREYLEAHPNEDVNMEFARDKWGEYGPVVLAALQDPSEDGSVAQRLFGQGDEEPFNAGTVSNGLVVDHRYNGDKGDLFRDALCSRADLNLADSMSDYEASAGEGAVSAEEWVSTGTDAKAEEARAWKSLGLSATDAVSETCNDQTTKMLEAAKVAVAATGSSADVNEVVSKWLEGDVEGLNPDLQLKLAKIGETLGEPVHVTSGYRSYEEQAALYQAYLNGTGNLAARPGTSNHESGNAADCSFRGQNLGAVSEARELALEYGLCFPVSGEDWHIELA